MSVNLAVGLGNSESRYALTRHNAGAIVLERLAKSCGVECMRFDKYANAYLARGSIAGRPLGFAFSEGFMNESGRGLAKILRRLKADISSVAVIYDDITIGVGRMKLSKGGSSGGHNGVADIMEFCGNSFVRVRIGVGAKADKRMDLADHVLGATSNPTSRRYPPFRFANVFRCSSPRDWRPRRTKSTAERAPSAANRAETPAAPDGAAGFPAFPEADSPGGTRKQFKQT